jgi:DNA-directed RNA polymerase specialized sigma24 family protein
MCAKEVGRSRDFLTCQVRACAPDSPPMLVTRDRFRRAGYGESLPHWRGGRRTCQERVGTADPYVVGYRGMAFREMKDYELDGLADEQLIAYVAQAYEAGASDAAKLGLGIFAYRRYDDLVRRALLKMPSRQDAEDVAMQTLRDVFRAAFEGKSVGEAVNLMKTILARRIADWHDSRKFADPLPEEADDDEKRAPDAATADDDTAVVDVQDAVQQVMAGLQSDHHRQVVEDFVFNGYGAKETAERVNASFPDLDPPMSDQNVHQIASRFRKDLREALGSD